MRTPSAPESPEEWIAHHVVEPRAHAAGKALDIMLYKALAQRTEAFWHSKDFAGGIEALSAGKGAPHKNPFVQLARSGQEATTHHRNTQTQLHDALDISDWISRSLRNSIDDSTARFQSGLAVLASVGSTAPFVGLDRKSVV